VARAHRNEDMASAGLVNNPMWFSAPSTFKFYIIDLKFEGELYNYIFYNIRLYISPYLDVQPLFNPCQTTKSGISTKLAVF